MTVFEALADDTRRDMLERLRTDGPLSIAELAAPYGISRQAVTKHLDALAATRLVRTRRRGRQRLHELDARPLREVERFLAPYAAEWDRRLERLRRHVEAGDTVTGKRRGQ